MERDLLFLIEDNEALIMGGLLAFRVGNYDNTAEREQFRFLCSQLSEHFKNSNEFCVFVGNYNIGCELDALCIKKDAIIAIEFKNYGGHIIANENGEWTSDGKTIKGGSRKTVLQQARINHTIVKRELKTLGVEAKQIKDVPSLIVFHQSIELENNLSGTSKSWLHITDDEHFIEKIDDITCSKTDLSPLGIVNLAELLNLNSFYLNEFSNAEYKVNSTESSNDKLLEDIKSHLKNSETPKYVDVQKDRNVILPAWLDHFIYIDLNAKYHKINKDMLVLEWGMKDILDYLGTYFPRSFAESYTIYYRFLCDNPNHLIPLSNISIFDFGCGTGGELVGMILALKELNPKLSKVSIKALDGNVHALRLLELIINKLSSEIQVEIVLEPLPIVIDDLYDFGIVANTLKNSFDCIVSFKAICEFVTKQQFEENNPYRYIINTLTSKLNNGGILCIADITTYNDVSQDWLPHMMDNGLSESNLNVIASNTGYNEEFVVSHSHKSKDVSKVAWRILSCN